MRPRNHSSLPKGIPKTKLQGSAPSSHNILQSQSRLLAKNRFSVNGLAVVHRRPFTMGLVGSAQIVVRFKRLSTPEALISRANCSIRRYPALHYDHQATSVPMLTLFAFLDGF